MNQLAKKYDSCLMILAKIKVVTSTVACVIILIKSHIGAAMSKRIKQSKPKGIINSHIQMPKSILRKFEDNHYLYYYDVKKEIIGNRGTSNSINTEPDYYSPEMENMLNREYETRFISAVNFIINALDKEAPFEIDYEQIKSIYSYFYALIARSPKLFSIATKNMIHAQFANIPIRLQHDFIVNNALEIGKSNEYEKEYFVSFLINDSTIPLVLPIRGMYNILLKNYHVIVMPVHPRYAILFVHKDLQNEFYIDNQNSPMSINSPRIIFDFNLRAFKDQCSDEWGYIVSSNKDLLITLEQKAKE